MTTATLLPVDTRRTAADEAEAARRPERATRSAAFSEGGDFRGDQHDRRRFGVEQPNALPRLVGRPQQEPQVDGPAELARPGLHERGQLRTDGQEAVRAVVAQPDVRPVDDRAPVRFALRVPHFPRQFGRPQDDVEVTRAAPRAVVVVAVQLADVERPEGRRHTDHQRFAARALPGHREGEVASTAAELVGVRFLQSGRDADLTG